MGFRTQFRKFYFFFYSLKRWSLTGSLKGWGFNTQPIFTKCEGDWVLVHRLEGLFYTMFKEMGV